MENEVFQPEGNYYDKYNSKNPIVKKMMKGFFGAMDVMLEASGIVMKGGNCLEAGCGEGNVTDYVSQSIIVHNQKVQFSAFDASVKLIEENKQKWPDVIFFQHDIYEIIDAEYLPKQGRYDLIICSEVMEHLERPKDALCNLMKYSDKFIISVPNEPIWRILNMARLKYLKDYGNTPGHIQHFSEKTICNMIHECGLKLVKIEKPIPWLMIYCEKYT